MAGRKVRKKKEEREDEMKEKRKGEMREIHYEFTMSMLIKFDRCAFPQLQSTGQANK